MTVLTSRNQVIIVISLISSLLYRAISINTWAVNVAIALYLVIVNRPSCNHPIHMDKSSGDLTKINQTLQ